MGLTAVIPNRFALNNKCYKYKIPIGAPISWFLNTDAVTATFGNLTLSMMDSKGNEWNYPDALLKIDIIGGYQLYVQDFIIEDGVAGRDYFFVIYDTSDDSVLFKLNTFKLINPDEAGNYVRVSYRNSSNIFNYAYEELPDYRNVVYLDFNLIANDTEYDIKTNTEATTGLQINLKSQLRDAVTLESYFFDQVAHYGAKGLSMHDDININFLDYEVKEGYEIETNKISKVTKGTINLWVQDNNTINMNI